jgi:hypothetical protein
VDVVVPEEPERGDGVLIEKWILVRERFPASWSEERKAASGFSRNDLPNAIENGAFGATRGLARIQVDPSAR